MQLKWLLEHLRPLGVLLVLFTVLIMGVYPVTLAVIDQVENPSGAVGSPLICDGNQVGSKLIAENLSSPSFFQPRNSSASDSGVDPDITPAEAYAQVARVSNATGIPASSLDYVIQQNINSNANANGFLAPSFVDVNALNVDLIQLYPSAYPNACSVANG
jgi:potassium-transporting ATPase KdpC subunit